MNSKSIKWGASAVIVLLSFYFGIISLISGWGFALGQFREFWYYIITLAAGFGAQIGLYIYLRSLVRDGNGSGKILAVSGTTSTVAMISCCAHYFVNILPIIAATGIATFVSQYQVKFFWIGLAFNFGGIIYIARKVIAFRRL